jgi:hypothetical protein
MKNLWFALSAVLALASCDGISAPEFCPAIVPVSVRVTVQDSVTGANVTPGSTLILRNAASVDSVVAPGEPALTAMGVGEGRTGTFTLTVRRAGYQPWTKTDVKVEDGTCGAETVDVTARLKPAT